MTRQVVLDTETTGFDPFQGDRIVEIGCIEMINRNLTGRSFHVYINPERDMPEEAFNVHGLSTEFLSTQSVFKHVAQPFIDFIGNAELIIHNAPFDVKFLNFELNQLGFPKLDEYCSILDTLALAKDLHPGQRNSLDALCKRYEIDNSNRTLHGALLDSELLAEVYLRMTGGQETLSFFDERKSSDLHALSQQKTVQRKAPLKIIRATSNELDAHDRFMKALLP